MPRFDLTMLSVCAAIIAAGAPPASAGDLTPPPGPVSPEMKSLDQVEPRIPIGDATTPGNADALYVITQPGSYYLTGNITGVSGKDGIRIESRNVTLDLEGFALIGVAGAGSGINMSTSRSGVVIRNGIASSWPMTGVSARIDSGRIEHITASNNTQFGITNSEGASSTHIASCETYNNGAGGISAGSHGIVSDCVVDYNSGPGIYAGTFCVVRSCICIANNADGIQVKGSCFVNGNLCSANGSNGIGAGNGAGIHAYLGGDCRITENMCTGNDRGIDVDFPGNFIARNTCSGNTTNFDIAASNAAYVVNAVVGGAISGNSGGVSVGTSDPNANFAY